MHAHLYCDRRSQMSKNMQSSDDLTQLVRAKERGHHDAETINRILDSSPLCHIGYHLDGQPVVMPTIHWRVDDAVYCHGSRISRTMVESEANKVCLTVTHLDGLVLARSAFHHSANYRSVLVFGTPEIVSNASEKSQLLEVMIDKMMPGRWRTLRPVTDKELAATTLLKLPLNQASAKIRTGGPNDLAEDMDHPVWAGVVPLAVETQPPIDCDCNLEGIERPPELTQYKIG